MKLIASERKFWARGEFLLPPLLAKRISYDSAFIGLSPGEQAD
jgi:hypothetical protein